MDSGVPFHRAVTYVEPGPSYEPDSVRVLIVLQALKPKPVLASLDATVSFTVIALCGNYPEKIMLYVMSTY